MSTIPSEWGAARAPQLHRLRQRERTCNLLRRPAHAVPSPKHAPCLMLCPPSCCAAAIGFNVETVTYKNIKFQVCGAPWARLAPGAVACTRPATSPACMQWPPNPAMAAAITEAACWVASAAGIAAGWQPGAEHLQRGSRGVLGHAQVLRMHPGAARTVSRTCCEKATGHAGVQSSPAMFVRLTMEVLPRLSQ